jgi:RimJ/RimL family protein N-acetyltransferase
MIETPRLLLRQWRDEDRDPWRAMNADPMVMEHFPSTLDAIRADWLMERHRRLLTDTGLGFWAVERRRAALSSASPG